MNHSRLGSRLEVMAPMARSKIRASVYLLSLVNSLTLYKKSETSLFP